MSINGVPVVAAPARYDFVFNPFVAYADEPDNEGETSIAPLSALIQEKVHAAVGTNVEPGYTLDTAFGQSVMLSETIDWDHVFKDLPELDEYGNVYYYALVELGVSEDYTVSYGNSPISAELIRENMEARADQNNQNPPELLTLTATNTMKTGNLKLVKVIAPGSEQDTTDRFYFKVTLNGADPSRLLLDGEEIPAGNISTDESTGTTTIIVPFVGKGTHTLTGVLLGTTYEVVELNAQNNQGYTTYTMPAHWQQKGSVSITSDVDGGANKTIAADETETATITNEETADVPATKTWAPNNPGNVTIYFKLYYQRTVTPETGDPYTETIAVPNQPMQAIAGSDNEITVSWSDLPKYMDDGTAYTYVVKEFIQSDGGEYVENNIHYTEAAPDGYVKVENGLSITNTKSEEYNPKTNYTGTKTWVDPNKSVRPDSLHVTLMIDDGDGNPDNDQPATYVENGVTKRYEAQWTKGEGELSDEWFYTFHNLPVFDEYGNAIDYYVVEAPANGYSQTSTNINKKKYIRLTEKYIENIPTSGASYYDYPLTLQHETDLPFVAIRENDSHADRYGNAYTFHVWTPRQLTDDDERRAVIAAINGNLQSLGVGQADLANLNNTRFVTGQPTGDPNVEVEGHPGSHKVDFMYWEGQPVGQGYRVEIHQSGEKTFLLSFYGRRYFQNICVGYLNYSYTPGTTDITNTQVPTTFDALKTWGNGVTPPDGSVIKIVLKASTSAGEIANLADAEHGIGIAAEYQTITLNGKVDVDTVTDETTQELLSGTQNTAKSFEDSAWHAHWTDLPEYDKQGRKITYSVKEITYTIGETTVNIGEGGFPPTYTAATDSAPYTVTNQIPTTKKSAKKLWNENQGATLPEGVKVTLTLSAKEKGGDGQPIELSALNVSPANVVLDGIVSEETGEVETAATLWAYTWNNLPEYYNGKEVEYTVAETRYEIGGVQYPTVEPNETNPEGYANFDHTFTNKLPTVVVEATKIWENHLGEDITDQIKNVQVEFELQELTPPAESGGEAKWQKVLKDADGLDITNPVQRDGTEDPAWKVSWANLPKYRNGELIQYRVRETYAWIETDSQSGSIALPPAEPVEVIFPVVDPDGDDNLTVDPDTGTASITNQLPPIDVAVYKAWDSIGDNWPDSRISVRMKLMKEGEQEPVELENTIVQYADETPQAGEAQYGYVTLTADATRKEWTNLPRYYDTGELIKYVVVEDGVFFTPEGGEPIEIDIKDYFDITIRNEIDSNDNWFFTVDNKPKKTEIKVTKVWTLNNEPITNKREVSYTLKRVYGQTDETVETYSAIANVGEAELSKIKYVVDETTEQGAWQIITIPELPLFHMNVDATANPPVTFVPVTYYVEESREGLEETTVVTYSAESEADPSNDTPDDPSNDTPVEKLNAEEAAIDHGTITIYNRDKTGSLTVTKALSGNAAETAKEFSFKVVFTNELLRAGKTVGTWKKGNVETIEEATSESIIFSSEGENAGKAEITFTLKGGERAEFTGLPEGTTFTVTEVSADQNGYETSVESTGGTVNTDKTVSGTISSAATVTADYTNARNTTEAEAVKEWKYDDEDAVWPETVKSVTFKLFKTVNGNKTEVTAEDMFDATGFGNPLTVTADTEDHKAVWTNLPTKYWLDAVEGVEGVEADPENGIEAVKPVEAVEAGWYDATYTVEEIGITYTDDTLTEVNGNITVDGNYLVTYSEADGEDGKTITITNTYNRTYVDLEKKWRENDQDVTASTAETQISARLYRTNGELVEVGPDGTTSVVTEGTTSPYSARVFQKGVNNVDDNDWKWRINNLPRYYWVTGDDGESVRKEYHYYFKEEPIYGWNGNPWYEATQPELEGDDSGEPGDGEPGDDSETPAVTPAPNTQANAAQVTGGGQVTITNNRFTVKLPSTGGAGTNALYATGAGLLILAAIWFIWDQRRRYTADM